MRASIIIPTYNGAAKLPALLHALRKQTRQDFELIVVVDGSTDGTEEMLKSYADKLPNLCVVTQHNAGRAAARNAGARKANSDLFIFYDDDVIPMPDSVAKHRGFHQANYGMMCGNAIEVAAKDKSDVHNYKAWLAARWTGQYEKPLTKMSVDLLFFTGANCSIPRELFWQLNGFDEELRDAEDYDLAYRAIQQGISVYYDKSNHSVHDDLFDCRSYISRIREYSTAHQKLGGARLNHNNGKFKDRTKRLVYKALAFAFWPRLIDVGLFVYFMPRRLRYQFYSAVIHALSVVNPNVKL